MKSLLTVERLKLELNYDHVFEVNNRFLNHHGMPWEDISIEVRPADEQLPSIRWVGVQNNGSFAVLAFGPWHGHYDYDYGQSTRDDINESISRARRILKRHYFAFETLRSDSSIQCIGIARVNHVPETIPKDIVKIRKTFFGLPSTVEPVDFSKYIEDSHYFIERRAKVKRDRIKKLWKQKTGQDWPQAQTCKSGK